MIPKLKRSKTPQDLTVFSKSQSIKAKSHLSPFSIYQHLLWVANHRGTDFHKLPRMKHFYGIFPFFLTYWGLYVVALHEYRSISNLKETVCAEKIIFIRWSLIAPTLQWPTSRSFHQACGFRKKCSFFSRCQIRYHRILPLLVRQINTENYIWHLQKNGM